MAVATAVFAAQLEGLSRTVLDLLVRRVGVEVPAGLEEDPPPGLCSTCMPRSQGCSGRMGRCDPSRALLDLHVPPYGSSLDTAAELDEDLGVAMLGSEPKMVPGGVLDLDFEPGRRLDAIDSARIARLAWRMRARIGERKRWYEESEEVER